MFRQILYLHWKGSKLMLLPFVVAAFAAPVIAVQPVGQEVITGNWATMGFLDAAGVMAPLFPVVAMAVGTVLALTAWNWDHKHNHIYALSLPVSRWEYALLKMGAGWLLLLLPAAFFLAGALTSTAMVTPPEGVHAYPFAVSARFLLASTICYAVFFALAAGTFKTAVIVLVSLIAVPVGGAMMADLLAPAFPVLESVDVMGRFYEAMVTWPGPFEAFSGNWTLFDV